MYFWFNGSLEKRSDLIPSHPAVSGGTLLGMGVFTTIGIWNQRPFALELHYARLCADATAFELVCPYEFSELSAALDEIIQAENITRGMARLTLTARGDGRWNDEPGCDLSILAHSTVDPIAPLKSGWSPFRIETRRATVGIKSTSYADYFLAWREARQRGLDEAILCSSQGALCEASRSNLFWTREESLFTPSLLTGCLPGIGRSLILEWAREDGIDIREATFAPSELNDVDTILLTGAATGVRRAFFEDAPSNENAAPDALAEHLVRRWNDAVQN